MRQKPQNSKGYAESLEFLPAPGLIIFKNEEVCRYNFIPSSLDTNKKIVHTHNIWTPSQSHYPGRLRAWVIM